MIKELSEVLTQEAPPGTVTTLPSSPEPEKPAVPSVPEEHRGSFIQSFADALYKGGIQGLGGLKQGLATVNDNLGRVLPPDPTSGFVTDKSTTREAYNKVFVDPLKASAKADFEAAKPEGLGEQVFFGFARAMGNLPPVLLSDVMTGGMMKMGLLSSVLPKMGTLLSKVPEFVVGMTARGVGEGIDATEGGVVEKTLGGVTGGAESFSLGMLYANMGLTEMGRMKVQGLLAKGLKTEAEAVVKKATAWMVPKMMTLGLAESFYNAGKENRLPTVEEMANSTTQAGLMGAVFMAVPHLAGAAKEVQEKSVLKGYAKRIDALVSKGYVFEPMTTTEGKTFYHGTKAPIENLAQADPNQYGKVSAIYGEGLYLTDNPDVARSYAKRKGQGPEGKVLSTRVKDIPLLDLEQDLPDNVLKIFDDIRSEYTDEAFPSKKGTEVYSFLRDAMSNGEVTTTEARGIFQDISDQLQKEGYKGLKHIGGMKTNSALGKHNVVVLFQDPYTLKIDSLASEPPTTDTTEITKVFTDLLTDEKISPKTREAFGEAALAILKSRGAVVDPEFDLGHWKDASGISKITQTIERTLEQMTPEGAKEVQTFLTDKIKENETLGADWHRHWNNWIWENPMGKLGMKPRSNQDKVLFDYAEKKATDADLKKAFPDNWEAAKAVVEEGRVRYKAALDGWNATREQYGLDPVPERADYVRHMRDIRSATDILGWFFSDKTPTEVAGIVKKTKQNRPISGAEKERKGPGAERSYILAMQDYGESVKNARFHLDSVQRGRMVENYIRAQAAANETAKDANGKPVPKLDLQNFAEQMNMYSDYLAGQPTILTKGVERLIGRTGFAVMRYLQSSPVMNMVSGNVSMLMMNALTAPQLVAYGAYHPSSMGKGLTSAFLWANKDTPLELEGQVSAFSTRRIGFRKIPKDWVEDVSDKGMWFAKTSDHFMLNTIVASRYWEGRRQGLSPKDSMLKADDDAVRIIGDRSLGQQPLLFAEPALKFFSALQFEINNQWSNLTHDLPKEYAGQTAKLFGAYAIYALTANLVNSGLEKVLGRRPGFDPLYALSTLAGWDYFGASPAKTARPFSERFSDAAENVVGNIPFMQLAAVKGGRFPISAAFPNLAKITPGMEPMVKDIQKSFATSAMFPNFDMGNRDTSAAAGEMVLTALFLNPLGWGGQAKKTWQGFTSWNRGYVETAKGNVRFAVRKDFSNFVKGFLFGQNSFRESVAYWNSPESERN